MPQLEEILTAYSVNSGETYSLEISNIFEYGNPEPSRASIGRRNDYLIRE